MTLRFSGKLLFVERRKPTNPRKSKMRDHQRRDEEGKPYPKGTKTRVNKARRRERRANPISTRAVKQESFSPLGWKHR